MNSYKLKDVIPSLTSWRILTSEVVETAPLNTGLYVFRKVQGEMFGRLNGESDIIYIGSATGGSGIRARLKSHLNPGPTQLTNLRSKWLQRKLTIEVAWAVDPDASTMEEKILRKYEEEHWELPPLNRAIRGPWGKPL